MALFVTKSSCYKFGVIMLFVVTAVFVISFVAPYWLAYSSQYIAASANHSKQTNGVNVGLWMWCLGASPCFPGVPSLSSDDFQNTGWLQAVRAMEALCLLGLVAACVSAVVTNCVLTTPRACLSVVDAEFVAGFSGILGFGGTMVFLAMMKPATNQSNGPVFVLAFYIAAVITFIAVIVAVIIAVGNRGSSRRPSDVEDRGVTVNVFPLVVLGGDSAQARGQGNDSALIQGDHASDGLPPRSQGESSVWTLANSSAFRAGNSAGSQGGAALVLRGGSPSNVQGDNHSCSFLTGADSHVREYNFTPEEGNPSGQGDNSGIQDNNACDSSVQGGNPTRAAFWPELSALSPDRVLPTAPPLDFD